MDEDVDEDAVAGACRGFCYDPGPVQSVQRAEFWGVILALQANDGVHLGVDNLSVVRHVGRLLDGKTASRPAELQLYVPREASFPIPLKYIDVARASSTSLDVMLEKISTIIGTLMEIENCQIRGQVSQGSRYWMKNHRMDTHGPGETDKERKTTSRPDTFCGQKNGERCRTSGAPR